MPGSPEGPAAPGEDEDIVCRYCFGSGRVVSLPELHALPNAEEDALVVPCRCEGSQRYVHLACLRRWQLTLVGDRVPMAERGGVARMLARMVNTGDARDGQATDADCYGDVRSAVCQVCTAPFRVPPPTRYAMLREKVGAAGVALVRAGGMLVKKQTMTEPMERAVLRQEEALSPPMAAADIAAAQEPTTTTDPPEEPAPVASGGGYDVVVEAAPERPVHADANAAAHASSDSEEDGDGSEEGDGTGAPSQQADVQRAIFGVLRLLMQSRHGHWAKAAYLILSVSADDPAPPDLDAAAPKDPAPPGDDALCEYARRERRRAEAALRTKVVGVNLCRYERAGPVVTISRAGGAEGDVAARLRVHHFTGGPVGPNRRVGICSVGRALVEGAGEVMGEHGLTEVPLGKDEEVCLWGALSDLCDFLKAVLQHRPGCLEVVVNSYAGTAVWNKTQLLGEMGRGDWGVVDARPADLRLGAVVEAAADTPWVRLMADPDRLAQVQWAQLDEGAVLS